MNKEAKEFWNWVWETDAGILTKICNNYDKKQGLKQNINFHNEGDMEI